jgi:uncharacterized protein (TIGR01615 family)
MKVHRMKAISSFFRSPFGGGCVADGKANQPETVPKVPSLLFDMELEEAHATAAQAEDDDTDVETVLQQLTSLTDTWNQAEAHLVSHMRLVQNLLDGEGMRSLDALEVAEGLRRLGHSVVIRTALGGGWGGDCLRNLRHTFLWCSVQGLSGSQQYIVDPCFKEQFEIPHQTQRYAQVLAALPRIFIGTEERIVPLVELLCSEIRLAFKQANATLPPWRAPPAMLSKWRPRKSEDCVLEEVVLESHPASVPQWCPVQQAALAGSEGSLSPSPRCNSDSAVASPGLTAFFSKPVPSIEDRPLPSNTVASVPATDAGFQKLDVPNTVVRSLKEAYWFGCKAMPPAPAMAAQAAKHALHLV